MGDPVIHPVVLCGGSGTRLWPISRQAYPKQFVPLLGGKSLYQATLARFQGPEFAPPLVLTTDAFRFLVTEQASTAHMPNAQVVVEPLARDTGPAIVTAALMLEDTPEALMLVVPSDHLIEDEAGFHQAVEAALPAAQDGALMTFGVPPTRAETGYGYLELATEPEGLAPIPLKGFREKPDQATAEEMVKNRVYLWNSGLFFGRVDTFLTAIQAHAPDLIEPCRAAIAGGAPDLGFFRLAEAPYADARAISFDYAVMEAAERVAAVPMICGWSDLGAWDAMPKLADGGSKADGVATRGSVLAMDCADSYLHCDEDSMHLVGLGLEGVIAVATRDAVLVADASRAQDVKQVVEHLRAADVPQADAAPRMYRPWGWYETLCLGNRFQVKRIMVNPGASLSLQSHHHRSEHWVVVAGTAEVTVGDDVRVISENESTYIPLGTTHRLKNPGKLPMYLVEVQTGAYLGEDDIVRYEDVYNRED